MTPQARRRTRRFHARPADLTSDLVRDAAGLAACPASKPAAYVTGQGFTLDRGLVLARDQGTQPPLGPTSPAAHARRPPPGAITAPRPA